MDESGQVLLMRTKGPQTFWCWGRLLASAITTGNELEFVTQDT